MSLPVLGRFPRNDSKIMRAGRYLGSALRKDTHKGVEGAALGSGDSWTGTRVTQSPMCSTALLASWRGGALSGLSTVLDGQ